MKPAGRRRNASVTAVVVAAAGLVALVPLSAVGVSVAMGRADATPRPTPAAAAASRVATPTEAPPHGAAGLPWEDVIDDYEGGFLLPAPTPGGTPSVAMEAWTTTMTAARSGPGPGGIVDFVLGEDVPVAVVADQVEGEGWLLVQPDMVVDRRGYVPVAALAYDPPASSGATASIGALSPELEAYLSGWGDQVGVAVKDLATGTTYSYNGDRSFITASSVKVPLMFALLRQLEAAGEAPTEQEVQLLTAMIEWSDNDAAEAVNLLVGDRAGLQAFADELGIDGFHPGSTYAEGWGWGTLTPNAMAQILDLFERGQMLSDPANTALARELLANVESDQRTGVGTTAPDGAFVMMKNGWVPGPDELWVFNSSGIVELGGRAYIVAAYTAHNESLEQGEEIVVNACSLVAAALG